MSSCANDAEGFVVIENHLPVGTARYKVCAACGLVLVNVDGLYRPDIDALLAAESVPLW